MQIYKKYSIQHSFLPIFCPYTYCKTKNAKKVLDVLYDEPAINRKKICELTGIKEGTVKNIINSLLEKDIIIETTGYSRNQIFKFKKYTDLFLK